jgi:hypothetical protein
MPIVWLIKKTKLTESNQTKPSFMRMTSYCSLFVLGRLKLELLFGYYSAALV